MLRRTSVSGPRHLSIVRSAEPAAERKARVNSKASEAPRTLALPSNALKNEGVSALAIRAAQPVAGTLGPGERQKITFRALGEENALPPIPAEIPLPHGPVLDTVVVGGGLSGLTTLYKLANRNAMMLELADETGGVAAEGQRGKITYARGAAYFTWPRDDQLKLYHELGLGDPSKVEIKNPIDNFRYYVGNKPRTVKDIWEKGLKDLPKGFQDFKDFLETLDGAGMIGDVPLETREKKVQMFDQISVAELIAPFGKKVHTLLDLYCQSALGGHAEDVSAMAFLNFYIDEIGPRYTFPGGTAGVTARLAQKIKEQDPKRIQTGAFVYDLHNRPDGLVEVRYVQDGQAKAVLAKKAVVTTPTNITAKIVTDLPEEQKNALKSFEHANYLVHNFFTPHLVFDKGYDTWCEGMSFTDVIVGRWQEAAIAKEKLPKSGGILTVYQPLPREMWGARLTDAEVEAQAMKVLEDLKKVAPRLKKEKTIEIESNRWPASIHITKPGLVTTVGATIRKPDGNIVFGGNQLGIPEFEEAITRGFMAAQAVEDGLKAEAPVGQPRRDAVNG